MLKVTDLSKVLGTRSVLENVSIEVDRGEVGVVLGENGSGKSTLRRVISGVLAPDAGDVKIDGLSMRRNEVLAKAKLGYVPDATEALPDLLVREFIALVWALKRPLLAHAEPPSEAWIARLGLLPIWGQSIGSLSFGQRKRTCLLAALCGDPPLLVLDEPSNGLDPEGSELIATIIDERRASERTTILSTNDAAFATRVDGTRHRLSQGTLLPA